MDICNNVDRIDLTIKLIAFMPLYHFAIMNSSTPATGYFTSNKLTAACRLFACVHVSVELFQQRHSHNGSRGLNWLRAAHISIYNTHIYICRYIEFVFRAHMAILLTFCTGFINFVKYFILNIFGYAPGPKITFLHTRVYVACVDGRAAHMIEGRTDTINAHSLPCCRRSAYFFYTHKKFKCMIGCALGYFNRKKCILLELSALQYIHEYMCL